MIVKRLVERLPIGDFAKLILGSVLVALLISLGTVGILELLGFRVSPAIPSAFGAIGASIYGARTRKGSISK